ncbi:MAG TPA: lanthionine synthetase C family protein [Polyangia bacterium]
MSESWRPLVRGAAADEARRAVLDIAEALATTSEGDENPTLADGDAGVALFFDYLGRVAGDDRLRARAGGLLDRALASTVERALPLGLYTGVAGVGWALAHVDPSAELDELDGLLLDRLDRSPWSGTHDLIEGLVGIGVYALERSNDAFADAALARIVARLDERAERSAAGGVTWKTPVEHLPAHHAATFASGYYNLGLSHGVPGVVALLGRARRRRKLPPAGDRLLDGAVTWLLARPRDDADAGRFPAAIVEPDGSGPSSRCAWCYGDPGVAAALWLAGRDEALTIARHAASLACVDGEVLDAGLCHGAAGLLHIYLRLSQHGDETLAAAARHWLRRTLDARRPGTGLAGWLAFDGGRGRPAVWRPECGFLIGVAGIGLALTAAISEVAPAWDRALLLSA